ncbi:MAG: ImmA/IrrE family metallo-endopeptidase [Clostridia bacterium]|nr:ImmA/IrrE family metallo-endopeptidase [Clostridia bacterium]
MYRVYAERALRMIRSHLQNERSLSMLCRAFDIKVKRVEGSALSNGYVTLLHGKAYILIKSGLSVTDGRVTLAHELAHLLLGHVGDWKNIKGRTLPANRQEREADHLAALILSEIYD